MTLESSKHHMGGIKTVDKVGGEGRRLFDGIDCAELAAITREREKSNIPSAGLLGSEM